MPQGFIVILAVSLVIDAEFEPILLGVLDHFVTLQQVTSNRRGVYIVFAE